MAEQYLIFIDTNILLDFYRVRGRESGLSILKHIDDNLDRFITTNQVEMEFKKNRQRVIVESHQSFKLPDFGGLQLPAFLSESKQSKALEKNQKQLKSYAGTLKTRMTSILRKPTTHDRVFKTAHRLFRASSDLNLTRDKKIRLKIRTLAKKRFILGYPPRKDDATSIGDSINWEWIVHCASESGGHVVIVTRDSDYGVTFEKQSILNDWLATEFRARVSQKRKIVLTDRLSAAMKLALIKVTAEEVAAETALISERRASVQPKAVNLMEALRRLGQARTIQPPEPEFDPDYDGYDPEPDEPDGEIEYEPEPDDPDAYDLSGYEPEPEEQEPSEPDDPDPDQEEPDESEPNDE